MSAQAKCPQCGASLPPGALEGLCPACLLRQGTSKETTLPGEFIPFEPPPVSELARLFPHLEILDLIGKGGMGAIYKARQQALDRIVALKILPPPKPGGPDFSERFNHEARALARLNHPNIVAVHEFGHVEGWHYLLMEYVDGVNLRQLQRSEQLSPKAALQIVPQICDALQYAHDQGVVHRDIKPENVLIDRQGRVKIADFGLAKILGLEPSGFRLTGAGQVMGTPHYMAPEQIERPLEVDHRADIYALGVVFYEMLTGELPLGKFAPPSRKVQVDVRLDEVVLRALEKEPERRFQQAGQVKTAVENIAASPEPGTSSAPASVPLPPDGWNRFKNRFWPPLVGRRGGRRVIHWPALAMRSLRGVFMIVWLALVIGLGVGIGVNPKVGLMAGGLYFLVTFVLLAFVMSIRLLRGFALPLNQLPDLGPGGAESTPSPPVPPGARKRSVGAALSAAVAVFLLVLGLAAVITFIVPEQYVSTARIRIGQVGVPDFAAIDPFFMQTEVETIRSQLVLAKVVNRLELPVRWRQRFGTDSLSNSMALELLNKFLDVRQSRNTSLIEIRVFDDDNKEAAEIANAIVDAYRDARPIARVEVVDHAEPARRPARPNIPLNLFLGGVAGLILGQLAGIAVFLAKSSRLGHMVHRWSWATAGLVLVLALAAAAALLVHSGSGEPNVAITGLVTDTIGASAPGYATRLGLLRTKPFGHEPFVQIDFQLAAPSTNGVSSW
jgi:capsular polysaccharide biosynthesis protein/predicted Ser/Thr protein kinase